MTKNVVAEIRKIKVKWKTYHIREFVQRFIKE